MKSTFFIIKIFLLVSFHAYGMHDLNERFSKLELWISNIEHNTGDDILFERESDAENLDNRKKYIEEMRSKDQNVYDKLVKRKQIDALRRVVGIMHVEGTLTDEVKAALQRTRMMLNQ